MQAIETAYRRFSRERFALPEETQVVDIGRRIGAAFPDDYRRFLLGSGGSYFSEPEIIPPTEDYARDRLTVMGFR